MLLGQCRERLAVFVEDFLSERMLLGMLIEKLTRLAFAYALPAIRTLVLTIGGIAPGSFPSALRQIGQTIHQGLVVQVNAHRLIPQPGDADLNTE